MTIVPLFFWSDLFLETRAEILKKIFIVFLVQTMTSKSPFEINWPLGTWNVSTSPAGGFLCMMGLSAILEWTFDYRWMTNDVRPERPTATTSSPLIPGLWAASPAVWGYAAMAEAYEMKVMWRAVSTTFTFRQQRLTKVILYKLRGKLPIILVRFKKIESSWNNIIFAYFLNLN